MKAVSIVMFENISRDKLSNFGVLAVFEDPYDAIAHLEKIRAKPVPKGEVRNYWLTNQTVKEKVQNENVA